MINKIKKYTSEKWPKIKIYAQAHKPVTVVSILVLFSIFFYGYGKIFGASATGQYVVSLVRNGNITVAVNGTGQVQTQSEVDIKPQTVGQSQTLGQIVSVNVKNGDMVKAGQVIAVLDGKNALQTLNQAESSVQSAKASYDKLINGPTDSDLSSLNNSIANASTSLDNLRQNILIKLKNDYTSAANAIYLSTDSYFTKPMDINPDFSVDGVTFTNQQLVNDMNFGRVSIGEMLPGWKTGIDNLNPSSYDVVSVLNDAITKLNQIRNYFDGMTMLFASYTTTANSSADSSVSSGKSTASGARSNIDSAISDLTSQIQSYNSSVTSLAQNEQQLAYKIAPPTQEDITVSKSQLDNATANYNNALQNYQSRIITAPFDGQIGGLTAQVGQQVSSGDSLGKIITSSKIVNISLNEVDAAKVTANDSVVLTFDALTGVTASGHIRYIDPLGVVSSGVVSYNVSISIDENNDQIKTGMTAEASIVTDSKTGVLTVPNSAIKTSGNRQYVLVIDTSTSTMQISTSSTSTRGFGRYGNGSATGTFAFSSSTAFSSSSRRQGTSSSSTRMFAGAGNSGSLTLPSTTPVKQVFITTGVTDNTNTEVLSGLQGGELIVVRSTTVTTSTTKTAASSATSRTTGGFGIGGGAGGLGRALGGGAVAVPGLGR